MNKLTEFRRQASIIENELYIEYNAQSAGMSYEQFIIKPENRRKVVTFLKTVSDYINENFALNYYMLNTYENFIENKETIIEILKESVNIHYFVSDLEEVQSNNGFPLYMICFESGGVAYGPLDEALLQIQGICDDLEVKE